MYMTSRIALNDDEREFYSFLKGTIIMPFSYGLHRNEKYRINLNVFGPYRFFVG